MRLSTNTVIRSLIILDVVGLLAFGQAPTSEDSCSDKRYQLAEGAYNAKDFSQAKVLAGRLLKCPDPISSKAQRLLDTISTRERNNGLAGEAFAAIRRGRFQTACELLARIKESDPSYPNLDWYVTQAGGCPVQDLQPKLDEIRRLLDSGEVRRAAAELQSLRQTHPDRTDIAQLRAQAARIIEEEEARRLRRDYQRARQLTDEKQFAEAMDAFTRLQQEKPGYRDVVEQLAYLKREQERLNNQTATEQTATEQQNHGRGSPSSESSSLANSSTSDGREAKVRAAVREMVAAGDYGKALGVIETEGRGLRDLEAPALDIHNKLIEEDKLLAGALTSFYSGEYEAARQALSRFLGNKHSRKGRSVARFYLGAAVASLHFLQGRAESDFESEARKLFLAVQHEDSDFRPIWEGISPRIRKLYETVR